MGCGTNRTTGRKMCNVKSPREAGPNMACKRITKGPQAGRFICNSTKKTAGVSGVARKRKARKGGLKGSVMTCLKTKKGHKRSEGGRGCEKYVAACGRMAPPKKRKVRRSRKAA